MKVFALGSGPSYFIIRSYWCFILLISKTHSVLVQPALAGDRTTVGGCCKSLSSGDYNYVTGINYITNIRTPSLPVTGQQGQQSWAIRFIEARVRERVERDCRNWINNIDTALGRERDPAIVMVLSKLSPDSRILCCKTLEILSNKIF